MTHPHTPTISRHRGARRRGAVACLVSLAVLAAAAPAAAQSNPSAPASTTSTTSTLPAVTSPTLPPLTAPLGALPASATPAPNLPPMPALPALPALVPLSVRAGTDAAARFQATSTTSTSTTAPGEPTVPGAAQSPTTTAPALAADSTDPDATVQSFTDTMAALGLPTFDTGGTLAARPLGGPSMDDLSERYATLGGTLTAFYAARTGQPLDAFVAQNPERLAALAGTAPTPARATSLTQLQDQLRATGTSPLTAPDLDAYAASLSTKTASAESQVALSGLAWASELSKLRGGSGKLGPEALAFSSLLASTTSSMVGRYPDLFAQVRSSSQTSPAASSAWRASMLSAAASTSGSLASRMPNPCAATMMTAMASGSATAAARYSSPGCGSCVATGLYMNRQMTALMDPKVSSTLPNRADSLLPPAEWNSLPAWQKKIIADQNPSLAASAARPASPTLSGCSANGSARAAVSTSLPGVFASLARR